MTTATEAIWLQLSTDLRRFIRRQVADDHVADDLLQETFLRIHKNIDRLRGADRLAAWVYQIARNLIIDHHRSKQAEPLAELDPTENAQEQNRLIASAENWLDELISQLPEPYRLAIRLSEIEELPQQKVADRVGISLSAAKSRVQRGRAMLKQVLDQCCVFHFDHRSNTLDCDPKPDRKACLDCEV